MTAVKLTVLVETYDHEGYCHASSCEYSRTLVTTVVRTDTVLAKEMNLVEGYDWSAVLEKLRPCTEDARQLRVCDIDAKESHGLDVHSSRLTVTRAQRLNWSVPAPACPPPGSAT